MYTSRRADESYYSERTAGAVGVLERTAAPCEQTPKAEVRDSVHAESVEEAKARMQRNLAKLLHYDEEEYSENRAIGEVEEQESATVCPEFDGHVYDVQTALQYAAHVKEVQRLAELQSEQEAEQETETETMAATAPETTGDGYAEDEDTRPTSTTMQFGVEGTDSVIEDLAKTRESEKNSYKLNAKGKVIVALYALAVMVILALIILNTGVLASLKRNNAALAEDVAAIAAEYDELLAEIDRVSSDEYVINVAENVYDMVKR